MLSLVNKVFDSENNDFYAPFWMLLGPFFLIGSLFLTSFSDVPNKDLFIHVIVGICLCLKNRKKGLIVSLLFLLILVFIKHNQMNANHLWQFGIEFSIALGFIISYFSFEGILEYFDKKKEGIEKSLKNKKQLEETLEKEKDFYERQQKNLQNEIDVINIQIEEKKKEIFSYKNQTESFREKILKLEKEKEEILNILKSEKDKIKEDYSLKIKNLEKEKIENYENLKRELKKENAILKEKILELENQPKSLPKEDESLPKEEIKKLKQINSLYKQLKKQFDEKKYVLTQTRKELFITKEKLASIRLEREKEKTTDSPMVKKLQDELASFEKVFKKYEEENRLQQELISELNNKLQKT